MNTKIIAALEVIAAIDYKTYKKEHPKTKKTPSDPLFQPTDRDKKDAVEYAKFHLTPSFSDDDTPKDYRDGAKKVQNYLDEKMKNGKSEIWSVEKASKLLNPIDNGRKIKLPHIENAIIVGKIGNRYTILDGNHRLLHKQKSGHNNIKVFVVPLDNKAEDLLAVQ